MKKYELIIEIERLWGMCQYWTLNRAFLTDNPNVTREALNDTYGLTTDDKEFFFYDYLDFVCKKMVLETRWQLLIRSNTKYGNNQNILIDRTAGKIYLYIVAKNDFAHEEFLSVITKYIQFKILWWWYKLKNKDDVLPRLEALLSLINDDVLNNIADATSDTSHKLVYHDGFVNRYEDYKEQNSDDEGGDDEGGDDKEEEIIKHEDNNAYFYGINLPMNVHIDSANTLDGKLDVEIHLAGEMVSEKLKYRLCLWKNPQIVHTDDGVKGDAELVLSDPADEGQWNEIDIAALQSSGVLPVVLPVHILSLNNVVDGDKVYYEFEYLKKESNKVTDVFDIQSQLTTLEISHIDNNRYYFVLDMPRYKYNLNEIVLKIGVVGGYTDQSDRRCRYNIKIYKADIQGQAFDELLYDECVAAGVGYREIDLESAEPQGEIFFVWGQYPTPIPQLSELDNGDEIYAVFEWITDENQTWDRIYSNYAVISLPIFASDFAEEFE